MKPRPRTDFILQFQLNLSEVSHNFHVCLPPFRTTNPSWRPADFLRAETKEEGREEMGFGLRLLVKIFTVYDFFEAVHWPWSQNCFDFESKLLYFFK